MSDAYVCKGSITLGTGCGECSKCKRWVAERYPGKTVEQVRREVRLSWLQGDVEDALAKLEAAKRE